MFDFLQIIFTPFGYNLLSFTELVGAISNCGAWYRLLSPDIFISWLFYFVWAYIVLYICFIMPFRYFKRILRVPDKKGRKP